MILGKALGIRAKQEQEVDEVAFKESEHIAGFHYTYLEGCSECWKENRLLKSHEIVNRPEKYEMNLSKGWSNFINNLGKK